MPRSKPRSLETYRVVRKRFSLVWGKLLPEELTILKVEEFQESGLAVGLSPRTINHQIGHVMSAINWASERKLINATPPKYKKLKVAGMHARKYLTAEEIARLFNKTLEPRWARMEMVVMLALYAGLRQQEISWLEWSDVDLDDGWLHVRSKKGWSPKSITSERSIPIADKLADYLEKLPQEWRWVTTQALGKQWRRKTLGYVSKKLFEAAGVHDGGPHTLHRLRGTFATSVLRGGGDLESLREVLGHSALSVTAGYLSATSESKRRAVGGLSFRS